MPPRTTETISRRAVVTRPPFARNFSSTVSTSLCVWGMGAG
ncbi:MAG: hypothetical protein V9G12_17500 [Microthrixaceae bacterium]